jgi:hypothetical protein
MNNARDSRTSEDAPYSHAVDTSIPNHAMTDTTRSRFASILYVWLALLIAAALIGYSLRSVRTDSSDTPKQNVQQAPI